MLCSQTQGSNDDDDDDIAVEEARRDRECVLARSCAEVYPHALAVHHYTYSWYERYVEQMAALDVRL